MTERDQYLMYLIELRDKETLETSDICLRILSTLIACAGVTLTLSIQLGLSESSNPYSWVCHLSTLQFLTSILCALTALGILLERRIRRIHTIEKEIGKKKSEDEGNPTISVPHSHALFFLLGVCVVVAFALFASATITLGLYAFLS